MREVAALAGVGLKTVSRVVNGDQPVSPRLTARVRDAIERLDYRHNVTARNLRRSDGKSATIGVLLEDVANPFSSTLHRVIENEALKRGMLVFAGSSDEDETRERELVAAFASRRVDGLIIVPAGHDHSYLLSERRAGTPMVFVDRPPVLLDADSVLTDGVAGTRAGVDHLIAHGHQRIGYMGDLQTIHTATQRYQGYREALAASGIQLEERLVRLNLRGIEAAEAATTELLSPRNPPTALFTGQNLITIGACRALRALGLHERVAVVGFDDFVLADLLHPPVTVIAQDPAEMGRTAASLLFRRIDGDRSAAVHAQVPTRLIARGSGELRP